MKRHIAFTGFMGSGKSTIGKKLSEKSGIPFIDLDMYIEEQEQKSIIELFEEGEEIFREKEAYYLRQIIQSPNNLVIALGGGAVCFHNNLEIILKNAWLVALLPSIDVLLNRLWREINKRPLLKHISTKEQLRTFIEKKLSERISFYEQADWVIRSDDL